MPPFADLPHGGVDLECCSRNGCNVSDFINRYLSDLLVRKPTGRARQERQCPERYITFGVYGGFNNVLLNLVRALILGAALNRTVLLPNLQRAGSPLTYMDLSHFCAAHASQVNTTALLLRNGHPVRAFVADNVTVAYRAFGTVPWTFAINTEPLRLATGHPRARLLCVAAMLPNDPAEPLIATPLPFYFGVPQGLTGLVLAHVRYGPAVLAAGDRFMRSRLRNRPFVAVHLRWLEGECYERMLRYRAPAVGTAGSAANESAAAAAAEAACDMRWPAVRAVIERAYGGGLLDLDPDRIPIFLAWDGQAPEHHAVLLARPNVKRLAPSPNSQGDWNQVTEQYICTRAALFIGNAVSSFSNNIALVREHRGHAPSTNVLAGYAETGLLLGYDER